MKYISNFLVFTLSAIIFWFLILSTFFVDNTNKLKNLDFTNTKIWEYELTNNKEDLFYLNKISWDFENKIILNQLTKTSRMFTIDWDYEKTKSWTITEIILNKWLYLFDINEINHNLSINANWFKIDNLWIWKFFINFNDPNRILIFSIDSILNLSLLKTNKELITNVNIYPHLFLLLNTDRLNTILSSTLHNSDALKITKILNIQTFNNKIFTENSEVNKEIIDIFSLKNEKYINFINTSLSYIYNDYIKSINNEINNLNIWIISQYINKYFVILKNDEKKQIYYKNLLLQNLILLKNKDKLDLKLHNKIIEDLDKLSKLDKNEADKIIDIIYFFYLNSFKNIDNNIVISENFWNLISKIKKIDYLNKKNSLILKNIYYKYDFINDNSIFENINNFTEQYLKDEELSKTNIDYLLSFIWNLSKNNINDINNNTEKLILSLWTYIEILIEYFDTDINTDIKTTIYNITEILNKTYIEIKNEYFELEKNDDNLLVRNKKTSIKKETLIILKNSIKLLDDYIRWNLNQIKKDINTDILIEEYDNNIFNYEKIILALEDIEKYKKEYNKSYDYIDEDSININNQNDYLINTRSKIINYLFNFNWINLNWISINEKNQLYCNNPIEENYNSEEEIYCYEINDLIIMNKNYEIIKLNFLFFPYENNKIDNIIIEKNWEIKKFSWNYILNNEKIKFEEEMKNVSTIIEKEKYDFKNYFLITFNDIENINEIISDNNNDIKDWLLEEDKVIKAFKRDKLLWDKWDFIILKWFLDIMYDQLKVTQDENWNFTINIIDSSLTTNIKQWTKIINYKIDFNSNYIFSPNHSFNKINLKFINTKDNKNKNYLLSDNLIYINNEIKIIDLKNVINKLISNFNNIESIINNLYNKNLIIEYNNVNNEVKFETQINNKILTLYLQSWKIIKIYYNWNAVIEEAIEINGLQNILNNLN